MDADVTIMFCPSGRRPISRSQVKVNLSQEFCRKELPSTFQSSMDEVWSGRLAANPTLWNGTKFRLSSVLEDDISGQVIFNIGITSYKDFICTNWSPRATELSKQGQCDHLNPQAYMSDALGVGSLVITACNQVILLKRSDHLAEAPGLWDIPGGHPEPKELVGMIEASDIDISQLSAEDVVDEIFDSTLSEIISEVNIPREALGYPQLIGVARNTTSSGRPSSEYLVNCSLSSEQVLEKYREGTQCEVDESTNIMFLPLSSISTLQADDKELWRKLAPSAKGCFTLYSILRKSEL